MREGPGLARAFIDTFREQKISSFLFVFTAYLLAAKLGQYVLIAYHTAPAVLYPSVGIAIGLIYLGGYKQWIPIALAQFVATLTSPAQIDPFVVAGVTLAYTIQPIIAAYALKKLRFDGALLNIRDALSIIGVSLAATAIAPTIITSSQLMAGATTGIGAVGFETWSRIWAGGVFSALVITPFLTTWFNVPRNPLSRAEVTETIIDSVAVLSVTYLVYWTTLPMANVFIVLYFLFAVMYWVALRMQPRTLTLAMFLTTVFGIMGSIIAHPSPTPLNQQLFADELFVALIAPIFLIAVTLVAQLRQSADKLRSDAHDLKNALARLANEDRSKNEFIAILGHELRNPLAPVMSSLEYLQLDEKEPQRLQSIKNAREQMQIMRRLLDDLLDIARVTQQKFRLKREPVAMSTIFERATAATAAFIRSHGHELRVTAAPSSLILDVDPARMTQIVMNLLFNAAKYTPRGGHIELSAKREGDHACIEVSDDGIGIDTTELSTIFEPFGKVPERPRVGTGLGIGLSITKRLVEMHGGTIKAHSGGVGLGSTFSISLPFPEEPLTIVEEPPHGDLPKPINILVVDDNEAAARGMQKLLAHRGHATLTAATGREALDLATLHKPEAILLDIGLPDMSGYDVARELRGRGVASKLIALTGYGQDEDKRQAQSAGFDHHLTKPISIVDVDHVLATS